MAILGQILGSFLPVMRHTEPCLGVWHDFVLRFYRRPVSSFNRNFQGTGISEVITIPLSTVHAESIPQYPCGSQAMLVPRSAAEPLLLKLRWKTRAQRNCTGWPLHRSRAHKHQHIRGVHHCISWTVWQGGHVPCGRSVETQPDPEVRLAEERAKKVREGAVRAEPKHSK